MLESSAFGTSERIELLLPGVNTQNPRNYRLASQVATSAAAENTRNAQSTNRTQARRLRRLPNNLLFLPAVSRCLLLLKKFWCLAKSVAVRFRLRISASNADFALSVSDWRSEATWRSSSSLSSRYLRWKSSIMVCDAGCKMAGF